MGTLMALRFELHLLAHAFKKDVNDDERPGIHVDHLGFYYSKYFKRNLTPSDYGVETVKDLITLVNDSVYLSPKDVLETFVEAELESVQVFALLTEEARRDRKLRIDLGEEGAVLKIAGGWKQGGGGKSWGKKGEDNSKGGGKGGGDWQ